MKITYSCELRPRCYRIYASVDGLKVSRDISRLEGSLWLEQMPLRGDAYTERVWEIIGVTCQALEACIKEKR